MISFRSILVKSQLTKGVGFAFLVVPVLVGCEAAAAGYECLGFFDGGEGGGGRVGV